MERQIPLHLTWRAGANPTSPKAPVVRNDPRQFELEQWLEEHPVELGARPSNK
jgi:hypothetical protein